MNQMDAIRGHLEKHGKITSMEAFKLYGCTRLSDKILKLREKGWEIATLMTEGTDRYGDTCRYGIYKLISKPEGK